MDHKTSPAPSPDRPIVTTSPPNQGSPARLLLLLLLLAVAVGALGYDYYVARPACEEADKKIQAFVEKRNRMGVQEAALVTAADIQKELGRAPTVTKENDAGGYTVEYYCWWGNVPLLNLRRHFIAVVYVGTKPRRYSSHYREEPPAEAYPIADATPGVPEKTKEAPGEDKAADKKKEDKSSDESQKEGEKGKEAEKPAEDKAKEGADKPKEGEKGN